jgi:hypothetical protein
VELHLSCLMIVVREGIGEAGGWWSHGCPFLWGKMFRPLSPFIETWKKHMMLCSSLTFLTSGFRPVLFHIVTLFSIS